MKQYNLIVCGGTFDHFHKGHKEFLKYAFSLGKKVIIGVTSDTFVKNLKSGIQNSGSIEPFEKRKRAILGFIRKEKIINNVQILRIDNLFGPTLSESLLDGIVVSKNTKRGAEFINQERKKLGLNPLKIFIAPIIKAEDGKIISSERVRDGEINREGKLYIKSIWLKTDLALPKNLREEFKKPFGILIDDVSKHQSEFNWVVSVGDVTTKKLNQLSVDQKLSVIDFKVARKKTFSSFSDLGFFGNELVIAAKNPAGHIMHNVCLKSLTIFKSNFEKRIIFKIAGEEDLIVLPLALAAPLGAIIYYGQPGQGIMKIDVSEKIKNKIYRLVDRFKILKIAITRGY